MASFYPISQSSPPTNTPTLTANLLPTSTTLDQHLEFIKDTFEKEDERKETLESKAGQLLGQAGLILSLVGIITPLIADSLSQLPRPLLYLITALFVATIILFTNSIYHASMLNKVLQWQYMQPSPDNIFKEYNDETIPANVDSGNQYKSELIVDYYNSVKRNSSNNNQKANFLNYAAHSFSTALLLTSTLILFVCIGLFLKKEEPSKVQLVDGSVLNLRQQARTHSSNAVADSMVKYEYPLRAQKDSLSQGKKQP
ncbi:hypothetical protein LRS06_23135 [Hymenobacter sp. J193]|uniref:hypothetical protein n=1 Tax=Hymenobacter sp. J193 TaxID=2898429 RepID=UPI0021518B1A|nr:hypothetical protein [Hymenobacter sp. J193]MCR5890626.1 hypothetical protein [Hymenobacter sp. J193]